MNQILNQKNLLLLHGPAIVASRKHLLAIKSKFSPDDVTVFEKGFKQEEFIADLMTISMFSSSRLIILENPGDDFTLDINIPTDTTLVIWADHEISSTKKLAKYVSLQKGEIINFPEGKETSVFPFLDLLANKDAKAFIELEKIKQEGFDIFYVLTMTLYLLRNLVAAPKNAPQFVRDKLDRQRKNFSKKQVKQLYKSILEIDYKLKTGMIEKEQAEFLLINSFLG